MNSPARFVAAALLLVSSAALAGPAVLLFPALGRGDGVVLQGRVLKEAPSAGSSVLARNLRRLTAPNWEGAKVDVSFQGRSATVTSGHDGNFEVNLQPRPGTSFPTGFSLAEAKVAGSSAQARVEVVSDTTPFLVISDFDETLAVTQVVKTAKLVESAFLRDSDTQAVVPGMKSAGGGSIINLSSIAWMIPSTDLPVYVVAKAGIVGLTRTLSKELGPENIRVNCISPGAIMTERQRRLWMTPEYLAEIMQRQSLKRELLPEDVARLALYLASDDSSAITGQNFVIDGGWV